MPRFKTCLQLDIRAADRKKARAVGAAAFRHLYETFNDDDSIGKTGLVFRRPIKPGKPVYVLTWGGGDEPESPAITLHRTKAHAMKTASGYIDEVSGNFEPGDKGRKLAELRKDGDTWGLGNETWISLERLSIEG